MLFALNNVSTVAVFRLMEASFGTSAKGSEESPWRYCLYCATVAGVVFDDDDDNDNDKKGRGRVRARGGDGMEAANVAEGRTRTAAATTMTTTTTTTTTRVRAVRRLIRALTEYVLVGLLLSAGRTLGEGGYEPFPSHGVDCASFGRHSWDELLHRGHLLNNAYAARKIFRMLYSTSSLGKEGERKGAASSFGCDIISSRCSFSLAAWLRGFKPRRMYLLARVCVCVCVCVCAFVPQESHILVMF